MKINLLKQSAKVLKTKELQKIKGGGSDDVIAVDVDTL